MKPEHVVYISSDSNPWEKVQEIMIWCNKYVGSPYIVSEDNPHVFDYETNGKWCAYINYNYNNGPDGTKIHSWCFLKPDDALAFKLKWL